jgi:hypothetical protein
MYFRYFCPDTKENKQSVSPFVVAFFAVPNEGKSIILYKV